MKIKISLLLLPLLTITPCKSNNVVLSGNSSGRLMSKLINNSVNMDGQLNQSFGNNTILGTNFIDSSISGMNIDDTADSINAIVLQPDGKIVVTGSTGSATTQLMYIFVARFNVDGTLDTTFGQNGTFSKSNIPGTVYITQSLSGKTIAHDTGLGLSLQNDGKIVVGGWTQNQSNLYYCALVRFTTDGTLDETFGVAGSSTATIMPGTEYVSVSLAGGADPGNSFSAITLQEDGKIVGFGDGQDDALNLRMVVARFNQDGSLDASFGVAGGGVVVPVPGAICIQESIGGDAFPYNSASGLVLQSDNKIVAVGMLSDNNNPIDLLFCAFRLLPTGVLDTTFGIDGGGTRSLLPGTLYINSITGSDTPADHCQAVVLQSDGKIVLGGYVGTVFGRESFALVRLVANGALDGSFGIANDTTTSYNKGTVYITDSISNATNPHDICYSIALQANGAFVMGGETKDNGNNQHFAVVRFLTDGVIDPSFGATSTGMTSYIPGTAFITHGISFSVNFANSIASMAISESGEIIAGGLAGQDTSSVSYATLAQFYNPSTFSSYQAAYTGVGAGLNS